MNSWNEIPDEGDPGNEILDSDNRRRSGNEIQIIKEDLVT